MMKINVDAKRSDDINITPMVDLTFVLLVIFIIMCTASVQGIKVNLPSVRYVPQFVRDQIKQEVKAKVLADAKNWFQLQRPSGQ